MTEKLISLQIIIGLAIAIPLYIIALYLCPGRSATR